MGKRGRRKQETERIQITLFISNKEDKEIHEHIKGAVNGSAVGRDLLLMAWGVLNKKQSNLADESKIKEYKSNSEEEKSEIPFKESEIIITFDEEAFIAEEREVGMHDYYY